MTIASSLIASAHTKPWPGTGPQTFTAAWPIQPSASPRRQRKRHLHTRLAHSQHLRLRQHRRSGASHRKTNLPHHQAGQISICSSYVALAQYTPNTPVELRPPAARTTGRPVITKRRATKRVRQRVVELYQSGRSARYVAGEVGVSRTTVLNILIQSGVERRPVGPVPHHPSVNTQRPC